MAFTVTYTVTGGTPNYIVTLQDGVGVDVVPENTHSIDGTYTFDGVPEGTHHLDAVDSRGCVFPTIDVVLVASTTTTETPEVPVCALESFVITPTPTTGGNSNGSITISTVEVITGNITYSIDGGQNYQISNVFNSLLAGTYTVVVKDDHAVDCIISANTQIFNFKDPVLYTLSFANVSENSGGGGGDGSFDFPYDSGVILNFNVAGNGGTGFITPSMNYTMSVNQKTYPFDNNIGINYINQGNATDSDPIFMITPRGIVYSDTEVDTFSGDMGCLESTNHSVMFYNVSANSGNDKAYIEIILYLEGALVHSFGKWVNSTTGQPPQPC